MIISHVIFSMHLGVPMHLQDLVSILSGALFLHCLLLGLFPMRVLWKNLTGLTCLN
ncbi:hypothetical protein D3C80_717020 [compost metagenome]